MTTAMQTTNRLPRIKYVSWARLEVEGKAQPCEDQSFSRTPTLLPA